MGPENKYILLKQVDTARFSRFFVLLKELKTYSEYLLLGLKPDNPPPKKNRPEESEYKSYKYSYLAVTVLAIVPVNSTRSPTEFSSSLTSNDVCVKARVAPKRF